MKILAFDTSIGACSASLIIVNEDEFTVAASLFENKTRGHVEVIISMIDDVLTKAGALKSEVDYIAVTKGPGTFAGSRTGLSAAIGLGLGLDIPVVAVTSLKAAAYMVLYRFGVKQSFTFTVCHDARRGEVYNQTFLLSEGKLTALTQPSATAYEELQSSLLEGVSYIIGSGSEIVKDFLKKDIKIGDISHIESYAVALAALEQIRTESFSDLVPLYIRSPDAVKPKDVIMPFLKG